jgi:hypothetical protein
MHLNLFVAIRAIRGKKSLRLGVSAVKRFL